MSHVIWSCLLHFETVPHMVFITLHERVIPAMQVWKRLLYYKRSWGLGLGETVAFWLNPKNKYVERAHFFLQVVWPSLWWLWRWVLGVIGRLGIKERSGGQRCSLASPPPTLDSPRLVLCSSLPPVVHRDLHHSNPICEALPKKCGSLHPVAIQCTG